jgi:hypothetical protein
MGRMGHISGKQISKQHSTVIDAAQDVVKFLQKIPEVTKIALGRLDVHLPTTEWRIKYTEIQGGIKLQVRGTNSIQQLMIYTTNCGLIKEKLTSEFQKKYILIF